MSSLVPRILSAAVALTLLTSITYFFGIDGLRYLCILICSIGVYEYAQLTIRPLSQSSGPTCLFLLFGFLNLLLATLANEIFYQLFPLLYCGFVVVLIWVTRNRYNNDVVLQILFKSLTGFFYTALLPSLAIQFIAVSEWRWFLLLLAVVFFGDIFAFFGGTLVGGPKLMPSLSPQKTISGAVTGLLGSIIAGLCVNHLTDMGVEILSLVILTVVTAVFAQNGDLFKSLVKRVAQVKDSGSIMPGHGGVLDRLDGVYFAAPVIYIASDYLTR